MIQAILLAAGSSRRFGVDKLHVPLDDGLPLVLWTARNLRAAGCPVLAVVRPGDRVTADLLTSVSGVEVSACPGAERGMGRSLAWGVARSAGAAGWLVALGDMPYLRPRSIRSVLDAVSAGASIAAPVLAGQRGHPVAFSRHWRHELLRLDGDEGARSILRAHSDLLKLVPCGDPGVLRDIDRPSDLAR